MARSKSIIEQGLLAALDLAADTPWQDLTLTAIAETAGLTLSDFHGVADKDVLADAAEAHFDAAMSAEKIDLSDPARERLFEVIMLRFEAMEAYRGGLLSLMAYRQRDPRRLAALVQARGQSAKWALACAGLDHAEAIPAGLKAVGLAWVIGQTERAWRKDTGGDFARTMAELDGELRTAENRVDRLKTLFTRVSTPTKPGQKPSKPTQNPPETQQET